MDTFYLFKRGGFRLAVNAVNLSDARQYVKAVNGHMEYQGIIIPSRETWDSLICGAVTEKRSAQIRDTMHKAGIL